MDHRLTFHPGRGQQPPDPPGEYACTDMLMGHLARRFRRGLAALAAAGAVDAADRILHHAELPPVPPPPVFHGPVSRTHPDSDAGAAVTQFVTGLHQAVRETVGRGATVGYPIPLHSHATHGGIEVTARVVVSPPPGGGTASTGRRLRDALTTAGYTVAVPPDAAPPPDADLAALDPQPGQGSGAHPDDEAGLGGALRWWQARGRVIRRQLIELLLDAEPDPRRPDNLHRAVDRLLTDSGLPGLPRAHLYRITATLQVTTTASTEQDAHRAAYRLTLGAAPSRPRHDLPITTLAGHHPQPVVTPIRRGVYRVAWPHTYLVCLRGTRSPRLAEAAVRLQLAALGDTLSDVTTVPLQTVYLGAHVDPCLDPDSD